MADSVEEDRNQVEEEEKEPNYESSDADDAVELYRTKEALDETGREDLSQCLARFARCTHSEPTLEEFARSLKDDGELTKRCRATPFETVLMGQLGKPGSFDDVKGVGVVYPEMYFAWGMQGLSATIIVCTLITYVSDRDLFYDNAFQDRMGYTSICIGLDSYPAKYYAAIGLTYFAYCMIHYAITDIQRTRAVRTWRLRHDCDEKRVARRLMLRLKNGHRYTNREAELDAHELIGHTEETKAMMSKCDYYFAIGMDVLFAISSVLFTLVLHHDPNDGRLKLKPTPACNETIYNCTMLKPEPASGRRVLHGTTHDHNYMSDDTHIHWHTGLFIQWIYALMLLFISNYIEAPRPTAKARNFMVLYCFLCFLSPTLVMSNYLFYDENKYDATKYKLVGNPTNCTHEKDLSNPTCYKFQPLFPWWLNLLADYGWTLANTRVGKYMPVSSAIVQHREVRQITRKLLKRSKRRNQLRESKMAPGLPASVFSLINPFFYLKGLPFSLLWVFFIPTAIVSTLCHMFAGAWERLKARFQSPTPDADCGTATKGIDDKSTFGNADNLTKVPLKTPYIGDIFGYFSFIGSSAHARKGGYFDASDHKCKDAEMAHGKCPVFAVNVGCPAVHCMDVQSAQVILLKGNDPKDVESATSSLQHLEVPHMLPLKFPGAIEPNFVRGGEQSYPQAVRSFLLKLLPKDPQIDETTGMLKSDPKWDQAMKAVEQRIKGWCRLQQGSGNNADIQSIDVEEEFGTNLVTLFTCKLLLGTCPDLQFVLEGLPMLGGAALPVFPWLPSWMLPSQYGMSAAVKELHKFIKTSKYYSGSGSIKEACDSAGLAEDQAFNALLTAILFNCRGMGNSLLNMVYLMSEGPRSKPLRLALKGDPELKKSFCWELLRFNGPPLAFQVSADTDVPTNAPGGNNSTIKHRVKAGTVLQTHLGLAQMDKAVWANPHIFKADRFQKSDEPKPTMAFGCPLAPMDQSAPKANSHACVFKDLAHPFLVQICDMLCNCFWNFDAQTREALNGLRMDMQDPSILLGSPSGMFGRAREQSIDGPICTDYFHFKMGPGELVGGANSQKDMTPAFGHKPYFTSFCVDLLNETDWKHGLTQRSAMEAMVAQAHHHSLKEKCMDAQAKLQQGQQLREASAIRAGFSPRPVKSSRPLGAVSEVRPRKSTKIVL